MPFAYVRFGLLVADVHAAEEDAHAPGHVFRPVAGEVPALAAHLLLRILQAQVADEQVRHDAALREGHEHVEGALVPYQLLKGGLSDLDFIAKSSKIIQNQGLAMEKPLRNGLEHPLPRLQLLHLLRDLVIPHISLPRKPWSRPRRSTPQ